MKLTKIAYYEVIKKYGPGMSMTEHRAIDLFVKTLEKLMSNISHPVKLIGKSKNGEGSFIKICKWCGGQWIQEENNNRYTREKNDCALANETADESLIDAMNYIYDRKNPTQEGEKENG